MVKEKSGNSQKFETILATIDNEGGSVGNFPKDDFNSDFVKSWQKSLGMKSFSKTDVTVPIASLVSIKDSKEIDQMKRSAELTNHFFSKYIKEQIVTVIDKEKKIRHNKFTEMVEHAIEDKKFLNGLDPSIVETCYPPIIQTGGKYQLKFSTESDNRYFHYGVIISSFGARVKSYCSNIVRTIMVNPSDEQTATYEFVLSVHQLVIDNLKDGVTFKEVYDQAANLVKTEKPDLLAKMTKTLGFVTGIEFREGLLLISPKCQEKVQKGMVIAVNVGFSELVNSAGSTPEEKTYAVFIGDTVLVDSTDSPAIVLTMAKKRAKAISIFIKSDSEGSAEEEVLPSMRRAKIAVLEQRTRQEQNAEDRRKERQKEIAQQLNEDARARLLKQKSNRKESLKEKKSSVSYRSPTNFPYSENEVRSFKIFFDRKHETLILPLQGYPTPFHFSTIKNASLTIEGDFTYLRINFHTPGSALIKDQNTIFQDVNKYFLKEVIYRASNAKSTTDKNSPAFHLNEANRLIVDVRKRLKIRENEEKEREGIVKQQDLVLNVKTSVKLKDLYIRPNILSKRLQGSLEAHTNGFRYISQRGDKVDILFDNIKHAIFQPCDNEMIICLHFHLRNAILFGKKKHVDVQFYTEVGELTTDLGRLSRVHDRDDLHAEQQERILRHRLKQAFKGFIDKVESITKNSLEFEVPFRELGFYGVPHRSTVLLQPTSSSLCSITEWPPFIVTLDDVELVHFERVQFQLKNFDMVFVFKDYYKKTAMVSSIPMSSIDAVKDWLNSCDIKYTEGIQSLNWAKIMKTIVDDPEEFFDQGGWSFLDPASGDEGEDDDDEEEEDETFTVDSDEASGVSSDSDEDSDDASNYSESSSGEGSLDSDQSSGKDWSDLEEEAAREDRQNAMNENAEERSRGTKRPHGSSHPPSAKRKR